ncbi:SDR family oxidoreductase [Clostridium perfringens]|uniref:SDR family oxidoreductase n=1 Tax=Clostridium perfringens TaxID=1502 RepID=UPI0018E42C8B|nr:SDR family oxidoreductase [Clostridium perfringens]MBI5998037.1 SDR family oxidoreductase [Clostridium perfringens]
MKKKVILITGASSGIGYSTAKLLLEEGHIVYCTARRVENMRELKRLGGKVVFLDVKDERAVQKVVNTIIRMESRIDVVFANSGYAFAGALETVNIDDAREEFDVNLFGVARVIKAVMPQMRKQKYGYIIVTSSLAGIVSTPMMSFYPASKHALEGMIDGFRMENKESGIKIVKIQPSFINTEFIKPFINSLNKASKAKNAEAYKKEFEFFRKSSTKLILSSPPPEKVAKVVSKIISKKNPKKHYSINIDCKLCKLIKRFLGDSAIDKLMAKTFFR